MNVPPPSADVVHDQLLAEAKAALGPGPLDRLEEAFIEYYRPDGSGELHMPGAAKRPWWDPAALPDAVILEQHYPIIRQELEQLLARRVGFQHYDEGDGGFDAENTNKTWNVFYFRWDCREVEENHALCPRTSACLRSLPNLGTTAFFSALSGGGHLVAHSGPIGAVITVHLGLIVPTGCHLRVGDETRQWQEGKCLAFQDTFEHEAKNPSERTRINLMLDVWHPELTEVERRYLQRWSQLTHEQELASGDGTNLTRHRGSLDGVAWWK